MKTVCMALLLLFGLSAFGQHEHRGPRHGKEAQFSPEQRAELHTKKLTLALDLTASQQDKIQELILAKEEARLAKREAIEKSDSLSKGPEQRFERMSAHLDAKIAHKQEMKEILSEEQYAKWEKMAHQKGRHGRHHKARKGRGHSRKG